MNDQYRVVQLLPADGWRVIYSNGDGTEFSAPLLAWGLQADGDVVALDVDPIGVVDAVTNADNFVRLCKEEPSCT